MPKKITKLTEEQKAQMGPWADRWIARGLCTDEADWATFEKAAERCYGYAGIPWHGNVVRVRSPLVLALAAPIAASLLDRNGAVDGALNGAVDGAVNGAVDGAVGNAVSGAVGGAVYDAVNGAVNGAVDGAVNGAMYGAVGGAVGDAVEGAVEGAVKSNWHLYLGGSFWVSWQAYTSFFREVCDLRLKGDLWERDRAYADAQSSAGWWWPHRRFVMVCDRPREIHREQVRDRGWGSHRLHRLDGPAISWRDGYSLYFVHGVRIDNPDWIINPKALTAKRIDAERNAEVRRVMLSRMGEARYLEESGAKCVHRDKFGELYRTEQPGDEPLVMVKVRNSTPEPDGSIKDYWLRVAPDLRPLGIDGARAQKMTARNAIASTFGLRGEQYQLGMET